MKKSYLFPFVFCTLIISSLFLQSCSDETAASSEPVVKIESMKLIDTDTLEVVGMLTSNGGSPVSYVGFSYSDNPDVGVKNNQVLLEPTSSGRFSTLIPVTDTSDQSIYVRAFAANESSWGMSAVSQYKPGKPPKVLAPCTLTNNFIGIDLSGDYVTAESDSSIALFGSYGVRVESDDLGKMIFSFSKRPVAGVYKSISDGTKIASGLMHVKYTNNGDYISADNCSIYINYENDGYISVAFCELICRKGTTSVKCIGKVVFKR